MADGMRRTTAPFPFPVRPLQPPGRHPAGRFPPATGTGSFSCRRDVAGDGQGIAVRAGSNRRPRPSRLRPYEGAAPLARRFHRAMKSDRRPRATGSSVLSVRMTEVLSFRITTRSTPAQDTQCERWMQ